MTILFAATFLIQQRMKLKSNKALTIHTMCVRRVKYFATPKVGVHCLEKANFGKFKRRHPRFILNTVLNYLRLMNLKDSSFPRFINYFHRNQF